MQRSHAVATFLMSFAKLQELLSHKLPSLFQCKTATIPQRNFFKFVPELFA